MSDVGKLSRRTFLIGSGAALITAPAIVQAANIMPVHNRLIESPGVSVRDCHEHIVQRLGNYDWLHMDPNGNWRQYVVHRDYDGTIKGVEIVMAKGCGYVHPPLSGHVYLSSG